MMYTLFESCRINTLTLSNRFIRSATWEGMAEDDGNAPPN
jgi:2,4-dienoyl-CoA reductase-like NADH-dependent reductase (Old Yellow Enzyme family)